MKDPLDRQPVKARILFTMELDNGAGFAVREDDGSQVYLTKAMVYTTKPDVGRCYEALLVPNAHTTALTPWFAPYVDRATGADTAYFAHAEKVLAQGGVWTGEDLARAAGGNARVWDSMLDALYKRGACSKFVRFDAPNTPPVRAWYTNEPDAADVDVWEDAE